jgi:hypothetical protein
MVHGQTDGQGDSYIPPQTLFAGGIIITGKFTGPNKVLLVLGWRTGAHCEDWFNCKSLSSLRKKCSLLN